MILTKEQIELKRDKHIIYSKEEYSKMRDNISEHSDKYDFFTQKNLTPNKPGQLFLYEVLSEHEYGKGNIKMTYPRLGVYLDCYSADQTIELEWVNHRRTWEYNVKYEYPFENNGVTRIYHSLAADQRSELNYLVLWSDQMFVYGCWDSMPNWKQLRQAYERTFWFKRSKDELRDIQLDRLLNGL